MSAIAEPLQHVAPDDNLARRNAMVLAAAQALAGGNNTVIVSTAGVWNTRNLRYGITSLQRPAPNLQSSLRLCGKNRVSAY